MDNKKLTRNQKQKKNEIQLQKYNQYSIAINEDEIAQVCNNLKFLESIHSVRGNKKELEEIDKLKQLYICSLMLKAAYSSETSEIEIERELDTSSLFAGQVFSNFNELCGFLSLEKPNGKRQREQYKKKFKRYFDFVDMEYSNNIMILEIYKIPFEKEQTNNGKYLKSIEFIILYLLISASEKYPKLLDSNGHMIYKTSYSKLIYDELRLINPYFKNRRDRYNFNIFISFLQEKQPDIFTDESATKFSLSIVYNKFYSILRNAVSSGLAKLSKLEMITLEEVYIAYIEDENNIYYWEEIKSREDISYYNDTRKYAAESLGYKTSYECLYNNKQDEFEGILFEKTFKDKGWLQVRKRIKIGFSIMHLKANIHEYICKNARDNLYNEVKSSLCKSIEKLCLKDKEEYDELKNKILDIYVEELGLFSREKAIQSFNSEYKRKYPDELIQRCSIIIDYLVNLDNDKIKELESYINKYNEEIKENNRFIEDL